MTLHFRRILAAAVVAGACLTAQAAEPALSLSIRHEIHTLGPDGVARTARFDERFLRQGGNVWIARVLPQGAHDAAEHKAGGHDHKHMDLAAAAHWFQRKPDNTLEVRLIDPHENMLIDLPPTEYAMIGFDGHWESVWNLLDPARLKSFKALPDAAPAGARWYVNRTEQNTVRILWDEKHQYPRRIESTSLNGLNHSLTVATPGAVPATLPWLQLQHHQHKDYSDLLD